MHIMKNLLDQILDRQNMYQAFKRVCSNKGTSGIDGITVGEIDRYIRENWKRIEVGIKDRRYKPQPVLRVEIPKPNDGYLWVVDIDLEKFFDTVPQDKLMSLVHNIIDDPDTESLIRKFLQAGIMDKGEFQPSKTGTPQGGNLSPLLSNIMLNELDKELESRELNFVRYADDCAPRRRVQVA